MAGVRADEGCELLGAGSDGVDVAGLPEEEIDGVKGEVGAAAGGRVDSDEAAVGAAVEEVARCQVAVEEGGGRDSGGEAGGEAAAALVELTGDHVQKRWVAP